MQCRLNAGSCMSTWHDLGGACGRPWQWPNKNEFKKAVRQIHTAYTAAFNPVSLYDDCGHTGFTSGSYLNWKILDGLEATMRIRSDERLNPERPPCPIVAYTSGGTAYD